MQILDYPHPVLRFKTQPLKCIDNKIRELASRMIGIMKEHNGIGLSANQVGLPFQMIVLDWDGNDICLINPVIRAFGKTVSKKEGCLSFPDTVVDVKRPAKCQFQAWALKGDHINEEVGGDLSRVLQHETDHLNGVLFIDRISDLQRASHPELGEMQWAWMNFPHEFPTTDFNELLHVYSDVARPDSGAA